MIYYMHRMGKPFIMSIDIEYDKNRIIQIGAIIVQHIGKSVYQPYKSLNLYIKQENVSQFVQDYTDISQEFLDDYGVKLEEAHLIWDDFMSDFENDELLIVSHGIHQDGILLRESGFNIDDFDHCCTYNMAKWILGTDKHLSLSDVLQEGGLLPIKEHNAYADALSTLNILALLLKLEGEDK